MNKAERIYQLVIRERPRSGVSVSEILELCEFLERESPRAIAARILDYLDGYSDTTYNLTGES